jgi:hypothetical protein
MLAGNRECRSEVSFAGCATGSVKEKRYAMSTMKSWSAGAWFAVVALVLPMAVSTDTWAAEKTVDPAAMAKLKQMTDFLDGLKQFSVRTQNTIEDLHASGHRVDYDLTANVIIKRPNKLRADRSGETMHQSFYYDGKTLTLYDPVKKAYETDKAPATLEDMITYARETVGILLPAADLLYRNAYPLLMQDVALAIVVGKSVVGGVRCDHLLFSRPGADFQVWVAEGKQPWPVRYLVTETDNPARLSITTEFSHWNATPAVDDAKFRFVAPKGTKATTFARPGAGGATGR